MIKPDDKKPQNKWQDLVNFAPLFLIPLTGFGLMGFLFSSSNRISGFLGGFGLGLAVMLVCLIGIVGWNWIEGELNKGKLLPYILIGFLAGIAISGFLAINLGNPSCDEQGDPPYSSCVSYADDGYEASSSQRWDKFWGTIPVTVIIASLIAVIVRNKTHKK